MSKIDFSEVQKQAEAVVEEYKRAHGLEGCCEIYSVALGEQLMKIEGFKEMIEPTIRALNNRKYSLTDDVDWDEFIKKL